MSRRQHRPARPYKTWVGTTIGTRHEVLTRNGQRKVQVTGAIRGYSKTSMAATMHMSLGEFNNQWSEVTYSWKRWSEVDRLLSNSLLGTLFIGPLNPGDTIDGQEGWVEA
jgi:hypothetical protein